MSLMHKHPEEIKMEAAIRSLNSYRAWTRPVEPKALCRFCGIRLIDPCLSFSCRECHGSDGPLES